MQATVHGVSESDMTEQLHFHFEFDIYSFCFNQRCSCIKTWTSYRINEEEDIRQSVAAFLHNTWNEIISCETKCLKKHETGRSTTFTCSGT